MELEQDVMKQAILPDYNQIDRETEAQMLSELVVANPEISESDSPFGLVTLESDSPYANIARSLECQVFDHYFGNDPDQMAKEYAPYERSSKFFLLIDKEKSVPAGVMRIITPNNDGFKSSNDLPTEKCVNHQDEPVSDLSPDEIFENFNIAPENSLDVATIAANPEYGAKERGDEIVLSSLMRAVYKYSQLHSYDELIAIIDDVPLQKLRAVGLPIKTSDAIDSPFRYLGADGNTFINIPIPEVEQSVNAVNPDLYIYLFGEGELGGAAKLSFQEQ